MGRGARLRVRRLALALLAVWVGRWALQELAMLAARFWLPPSPPALRSPRQPGRLPGPFDR
jgi:hypothetical protein